MNNIREHKWLDDDISVNDTFSMHIDLNIDFNAPCSFISISKDDVIAMAKHFGLTVIKEPTDD